MTEEYWRPKPQVRAELTSFLTSRAGAIDTQIRPHVFALQDDYLNQRP